MLELAISCWMTQQHCHWCLCVCVHMLIYSRASHSERAKIPLNQKIKFEQLVFEPHPPAKLTNTRLKQTETNVTHLRLSLTITICGYIPHLEPNYSNSNSTYHYYIWLPYPFGGLDLLCFACSIRAQSSHHRHRCMPRLSHSRSDRSTPNEQMLYTLHYLWARDSFLPCAYSRSTHQH